LVEGCRTLEDLRRHAHIGVGPCDGLDCAAEAAHIMAEMLDWSPERTRSKLAAFLDRRWAGRRPVLQGVNLAQEEITRGVFGRGDSDRPAGDPPGILASAESGGGRG